MNPGIEPAGRQAAFLVEQFCREQQGAIDQLGRQLAQLFAEGGQLLTAGTGLLQFVAQLIAAQFTYRLDFDRPVLPAVCLGGDAVLTTVMASSGSYEQVFLRHYRALAHQRQMLLLLSDGQASPALERLRDELLGQEQAVVLLSGSGREDPLFCDEIEICLKCGTGSMARQVELMQFTGHLLCELVEAELFPG